MTKSFACREKNLALIEAAQGMPTLPDRFLKIRDVIANPRSSGEDLSDIIGTDLATSAIILKIANSASYNPHGKALSSLPHAIARLGVGTSAKIAISMSLLQQFTTGASIKRVHALWAQSYARAMIAIQMHKHLTVPLDIDTSTIFMMALLHDIGQVAITACIDSNYFEKNVSTLHGDALCNTENSLYGIDHAEAGSIILKHWNMPNILIQSTLTHHQPSDHKALHLCSLADLFVYKYWPNLQHIEEVHQLLCYSPEKEITELLQNSPELKPCI